LPPEADQQIAAAVGERKREEKRPPSIGVYHRARLRRDPLAHAVRTYLFVWWLQSPLLKPCFVIKRNDYENAYYNRVRQHIEFDDSKKYKHGHHDNGNRDA
jgi:hypothetical protein